MHISSLREAPQGLFELAGDGIAPGRAREIHTALEDVGRLGNPARLAEQHARCGTGGGLQQPHQPDVVAGQLENGCQQVRIERRLIEGLGSQPRSAGNLLGPRIVLLAVADEDREERRM